MVLENVNSSTRYSLEPFDFKRQCFYCTENCEYDHKYLERNNFENVRTKYSGVFTSTLKICSQRNDKYSKETEMLLLSVSDLVAAEAKYHSF